MYVERKTVHWTKYYLIYEYIHYSNISTICICIEYARGVTIHIFTKNMIYDTRTVSSRILRLGVWTCILNMPESLPNAACQMPFTMSCLKCRIQYLKNTFLGSRYKKDCSKSIKIEILFSLFVLFLEPIKSINKWSHVFIWKNKIYHNLSLRI